jgi:hypothetical protein
VYTRQPHASRLAAAGGSRDGTVHAVDDVTGASPESTRAATMEVTK